MNKARQRYYNKLEIVLITYSRAFFLERTLAQFLKSPFKKCKFTILDNCSTDETPKVCKKYEKLFPNMHIIRHRKNVGWAINYLRAVELAEADYTWIICDDDLYNFSECEDIIKVIEEESHDLISVGNGTYKFTKRGISSTTQELIKMKEMFYAIHGFIPSIIFKTDLFSSECITKVSMMAKDIYPQIYFIHSTVLQNCSIYISKNEILLLDPNTGSVTLNPFYQFTSWVNTSLIIADKKVRQHMIYEYFLNSKLLFIEKMFYYIYFEKVLKKQGRFDFGKEGLLIKFFILFAGFSGFQFVLLILLIPLFLTPHIVFKYLGKIVLLIYYKGKIPADKKPSSLNDLIELGF